MIIIKSKREIEMMRTACGKLGAIFDKLAPEIRPGRTTYEIDKIADRLIRETGGICSFKLEDGYPAAVCASVNDTLIHGIPSKDVVLKEGDILSIDMGNQDDTGYQGDACRTFPVGNISDEAKKLICCAEECFYNAFKVCKPGVHVNAISMEIQKTADKYGFSLVKEYGGHGLGKTMHEDPFIYNYYSPELGFGPFLRSGMVIAIEPMVMSGDSKIITLADGWGVQSADHKINAHYENDVLITDTGAEVLSVDSNVRRHLKELEDKKQA
jgi:methionyl aminopeptidase